MADPQLTLEMNDLLVEMRGMASAAPSLRSLQDCIVRAIAEKLPRYNWTGFYMLDPM